MGHIWFHLWCKREDLLKYIILYQLQPDGQPPKYLLNQSPNYTNATTTHI